MAATVSAWAKPGAWALDAEEHEAMEILQKKNEISSSTTTTTTVDSTSDFPSLAAAAATKASKKKKKLTLAEFTTGQSGTHRTAKFRPSAASPAPFEALVLPTGPRERTAEELERSSSRGFNYSGYGSGRGREESGEGSRWGSSRASDESRGGGGGFNRDVAPSRADETDDWGAGKRSTGPPVERRERTGGFFDSQSRADESDNWISNKSSVSTLPSDGRRTRDGYRERRGGFEFNREGSDGFGGGAGPDGESWGRKKEGSNGVTGAGTEAESWGKKREEASGGGRPRLVLQPRSLPVDNGNADRQEVKRTNPFGAARPREEVLAEKGQDWKKIDEKLESMKIQEGLGSGRKSYVPAKGPENRTESSWRKPDSAVFSPPSSEVTEEDASDKHLE